MTTRSQQFKSDAERTHAKPVTPEAPTSARVEHGSVAKNATYAREEHAAGTQPSRRSTRKSANHAKTDTGEVRAEQMKQAAPTNQARKNSASLQRMRAGTASNRSS